MPMEVEAVDLSAESTLHLRDGSNQSENDVSVNYSMEHAYSTASKTTTSKYFEGNLIVSCEIYLSYLYSICNASCIQKLIRYFWQ